MVNQVFDEDAIEESSLDDEASVMATNDTGDSVVLRAISGSAYNGTISTTYLEYFNGIIDRLPIGTNYLIYRPDRYNYTLVYGDALAESAGRFSASEAEYVNIYSYDTYSVTRGSDSVNVSVGDAMVYSNIQGYPNSLKGVTHAEGLAIMVTITCLMLLNVLRGLLPSR